MCCSPQNDVYWLVKELALLYSYHSPITSGKKLRLVGNISENYVVVVSSLAVTFRLIVGKFI